MREITIKNFKGMNLQEGTYAEGYAKYLAGMDIFGLQSNTNKLSFPGVLQSEVPLSAGSQAAGVSAVTEVLQDFVIYNGGTYGVGVSSTNTLRLYERRSSVWTWLSAVSAENAAGGADIEVYGANLYYAQKNFLGRYTGSASSSQFQDFTGSNSNPRKLKVFNGSLYATDDRYVARYDGTTWTPAALTVPSDFLLKSIEIYGGYIFLTADNGSITKLFRWDGISPTFDTMIDIVSESTAPTLQVASGMLFLVSNRGAATNGTTVYLYTGSGIEPIQILPIKRGFTNGLGEYRGGLLIASDEGASASFEDGVAGVWMINRNNANEPLQTALSFIARNLTNMTLGGISQNGSYIGARDIGNSSYEVFERQGDFANATSIFVTNPIDAGSTQHKVWYGIKVNFEDVAGSATVVIKYRLDDDTSFTTLKTFTTSPASTIFIPLGKVSRTIDLRIELTGSASVRSTRLHAITLQFDLTKL